MSSMLDASRPASTGEDKRSKLKAGLLKQMQNQYGRDPVRSRLIEGELGHAPELRDKALTPAGLKAIEARVATAMANVSVGVGSDHRSMLPAEKKERKSRDASSDYNADLKSLATWTEVNKYREDFFNYEIKKDAEHRVTQLSKLKLELKHQQMEQAKKREQKKAVVRLAAEEEAKRYATYLKDSAAEEATRQAKSQMEIDMRSQQSEERRARRAVEQRLKELEDGETLRKINEQQEADRKAFEQKVKDDEKKNRMFIDEVEKSRQIRQARADDETTKQLKLNAEWKAILDKQEEDRATRYRELKERIAKMQRSYESSAGAEDAARMQAEENARNRWMAKFDKETREKEEAQAAHRTRMQAECLKMQEEQVAQHRAEKETARQEAIRLKAVMKQQAIEEKEERMREAQEEHERALRYGKKLKAQKLEIAEARLMQPGSHVMTPLEASLNRTLLLAIKDKQYEGFCATLG